MLEGVEMAGRSGVQAAMTPAQEADAMLARLGMPASVSDVDASHPERLVSRSPIDGLPIGAVPAVDAAGTAAAVGHAVEAALAWRSVPPPRRGELVRRFGMKLRESKDDLGRLVTLENGKILQEGLG
jgi:aldehyde dehydrogenase (NAD+)